MFLHYLDRNTRWFTTLLKKVKIDHILCATVYTMMYKGQTETFRSRCPLFPQGVRPGRRQSDRLVYTSIQECLAKAITTPKTGSTSGDQLRINGPARYQASHIIAYALAIRRPAHSGDLPPRPGRLVTATGLKDHIITHRGSELPITTSRESCSRYRADRRRIIYTPPDA